MSKSKAAQKVSRTDEYGAQSRGQTFTYDPDDLVLITDPSHPLYDPSVNDEPSKEFVDGIVEHGVIEPIIIRRNGTDDRGKAIIEVVDGRMRVKGARLANEKLREVGKEPILVEAKLQRGMRDTSAETAMIICNEHRRTEDLVTRSEKLKRYLAHGHTEAQARIAFPGRSKGFKVLSEVMEMGDAIKEALRGRKITLEIARTLAALPESKQAEALAKTLGEAGGRGDKAKAAAQKAAGRPAKPTNGFKPRTAKVMLKAIDTVSCMPTTDYRRGLLDAIDWALGKKEMPWSGAAG